MCGCMHVYVYALVLVVQFNYISKCPTTYIVLYVIVAENLGRNFGKPTVLQFW